MTLLGQFYWYSIPNRMISLERARRAWRRGDLPDGYLPVSRKPADVAAEACGAVDRSRAPYSLYQSENNSERLLYEVKGHSGDVIELVFNKETAEFVSLDADLLQRVQTIYEQNSARLPHYKMQRAVRAMLLDVGGENLHGSIHFMPRDYGASPLQAAQTVVLDLYDDAVFHCVPAPATPDQTEYVRVAVTRVLVEEINELIAEISAMLAPNRARKWRSDKIATIQKRAANLQARYERYLRLVDELERVAGALKRLKQQIAELVAAHEPAEIS